MRIALILFLSCWSLVAAPLLAQTDSLPTISYLKPEEFEIGGIRVTGGVYSDPTAIQNIFGLKIGQTVRVPGPEIDKGIRALWKLRLFTSIDVLQERVQGSLIFLEIRVAERANLTTYNFAGVRKGDHSDLNPIVNRYLLKGSIVTDAAIANTVAGIQKYYREKGFFDSKVVITESPDSIRPNGVRLKIDIDKGKKVRIQSIAFTGTIVKHSKLRSRMKKTRTRKRILASSKFLPDAYETDKIAVINYLNTKGHRDAVILNDTIWRDRKGRLMIQIDMDEGPRYFYRNITWKGNTIHDTKTLNNVLGIKRGDVYNAELLQTRLSFSQDSRDVSSLYMDDGYLFFNVDPVETTADSDSIDLELRVFEGPQATIDRVVIKGNDRTHEHVIRRELRTRPGQKFSRSDIIRSQREISNLGYFNQENIGINTPVNRERGTVDIEYTVEEKPTDQLELSAGWGGFGVIGTLGVSFNNFSVRNIRDRSTWNPLPQGDGQRLSLRGQTNGRFYQAYNLSFTEPWLGGKKPNSLTVGGAYTRWADGNFFSRDQTITGFFGIYNVFASFGTRLKWPDDNFLFNATLEHQVLQLKNYQRSQFVRLPDTTGWFNNLNLQLSLTRTTVSDPMYPRSGSTFSLITQITPPYSLFTDRNYSELPTKERFKWLEYHKWRVNAEWFVNPWNKLVIRSSAKIGVIGGYNSQIGVPPFERFVVGGDGLTNQNVGITGFDIISMRGYEVGDIPASDIGGTVFNKYTLQVRYPLSLSPTSTIYVHSFVEGANAWANIKTYNPFELRRSAGVGLRVFLPMFGLLGFDYGFGFDRTNVPANARWTQYGDFNIILGFEPD
jgi:outer membrane protein insertion porin family